MTAFLGKITPHDVPHSRVKEHKPEVVCKKPLKTTRFWGNAGQHYLIVGVFFCKSPILSRHCQPSNRRDLLLNLHLTPPPPPPPRNCPTE